MALLVVFSESKTLLTVEYMGLDGLLTHPVCKNWRDKPDFHRFSVAHNSNGSITLMAEFNAGKEYHTVGYLSEDPDLPVWTGNPVTLFQKGDCVVVKGLDMAFVVVCY